MLALAPPTPPPRNAPLAAKSKSNRFSATAMLSNGSAGIAADVAAAGDCDERTLLLSEEIVVATSTSSAGVAATAPPTSLPLVHTTATTTQQTNNNNVNNNNNASLVVSAKNMANNKNNSKCKNNEASSSCSSSSNNNNAAEAAAAAAAATTTAAAEDIETITTTTADEDEMSSDLSDKFPRPQKKPGKLSKLGTKSVGLKRVSFGSSKGSMVETLVFETPTPLSEHVESTFGFAAAGDSAADTAAAAAGQPQLASTLPSHLPSVGGYSGDYAKGNMDDSGIEVQEESERSIVRVSIYQSSQPQQICPPADYLLDALDGGYNYNCNLDYTTMATTAAGIQQQQQVIGLGAAYDRQQSTDSGWDNPFRPGGDLSREADEIVNMIRGGKPITPTEERTIGNGSAQHADDNCNGGAAIGESVTKSNISQNLATAQNGTNSHASASADAGAGKAATATELSGGGNNGVTSLGQVSKQVVPGPTSASHVVIDEKKNKKKGCCVLQ
ncbi:serine/threonine-protein kinase phg2 isoform X1 [Drosophila elegans]|uniref:serine/threonine-protein kinase phg2 isoform X1 n=2 Tax=Drosophila elegans TaxID=30023 RepID=UPI0007E714FC|nr:serine/threonine-protein kinase phg2 isoform X1 [Drosophila elegans]